MGKNILEKAAEIVARFCEDVNSYNEDVYQNGERDVWSAERAFLYLTHVEHPAWKGYKLHAAIVAALSVVKVVAHDDGYIGVYPSDEGLVEKVLPYISDRLKKGRPIFTVLLDEDIKIEVTDTLREEGKLFWVV